MGFPGRVDSCPDYRVSRPLLEVQTNAVARNVEIKARLHDAETVAVAAERLAGGPPETIDQHDTFYCSDQARLKLRRFRDGRGELIAYERPDLAGPKTSRYRIFRTDDAAGLAAVLADGLAPAGEVRKRRRLYLIGRTRVHLDSVVGLGEFLELEVVLAENEATAAGRLEAEELLAALGVPVSDLVAGAYVDLLASKDEDRGP